ncbi:MAG: hypothetical protein NVS9B15_23520 [Acidobacteriaceae bacterium]
MQRYGHLTKVEWAQDNPRAFLYVVFLRYASVMAAVSLRNSAELLMIGVLLLAFNVAVLLWTEEGSWKEYFIRPLAGSLVLYAIASEVRVLGHPLG